MYEEVICFPLYITYSVIQLENIIQLENSQSL